MTGYRDPFLRCPRCGASLEKAGAAWGCGACRGVFVEEPVLEDMLREMHEQPVGARYVARFAEAPVPCPRCVEPMTAVALEGVEVERCARGDGVWFDAHELATALHAAAGRDEDEVNGEVVDVRVGFWRSVLGGLGEILKLLGYGAVGLAAAPLAGATGYTSALAEIEARRRR